MSSSTNTSTKTNTMTNTMTNTNRIEENKHHHTMVYVDSVEKHCMTIKIYQCTSCDYWDEVAFKTPGKDGSCCDLQITKYSTRFTCYECSQCRRTEQDMS
jgi:hypothetical protein